eukprot:SAG31_NODE_4053_length_3633_cov_12.857951_1_plen_48_part_10
MLPGDAKTAYILARRAPRAAGQRVISAAETLAARARLAAPPPAPGAGR